MLSSEHLSGAKGLIYQRLYDEIIRIPKQITSHRQLLAKPKIEGLILKQVDTETSNEDLLAHLIGESLMKRIDRQLLESKNIYIQHFDIPQITLFYSMAEAVPFVSAGHHLANQYLEREMSGLRAATVFDIGIGKARQITRLLQMLKNGDSKLETLNIIGADPVQQNLETSKAIIDQLSAELQFTVNFFPICSLIEDFSAQDYEEVKNIGGDHILINSAFTFHHTSHPLYDTESRTNLLKKLAALKPLAITLVEPSSNHDTEELTRRVHHSWQHFGTVFQFIDEANIDLSHKFSIKEKFFGREIRDIFGVSDHFRSERHELYDSWLLRLYKAGFKPIELIDLKVELPDYCSYSISEGLVRLDYNNTTIVAVLGFKL